MLIKLFCLVLTIAVSAGSALGDVRGHGEMTTKYEVKSITKDPISHYVRLHVTALKENRSYLMIASLDIDDDGVSDVLISDGNNRSAYSVNRWGIYLANKQKQEFSYLSVKIAFDPGCFGVGKVNGFNSYSLISCTPTAAGSAKAFASWLDEKNSVIVDYYRIDPPNDVSLKDFYNSIIGKLPERYPDITIQYMNYYSAMEKYLLEK